MPSQRDTQEGTRNAETAAYSQAEPRPAEEARAAEAAEARPAYRGDSFSDSYYISTVLLFVSGLASVFMGVTGIISGAFYNHVANFPFYYSERSRGITLLVIGVAVLLAGVVLLAHRSWSRHVAITVAAISALANFMFLPFYPFWSVIVLALNVIIIWELERDRVRRREFAR